MSVDDLIRAKIYRLEELRKYQSYYGPNTPYPVVMEINDLEVELRRLLEAGSTRPPRNTKKKQVKKKTRKKKKSTPIWQFWRMSRATFDAVITIAFIGFVFLLGSILVTAYVNTRPGHAAAKRLPNVVDAPPTLRPTFTPTTDGAVVGGQIAAIENPNLPPAKRESTAIATPVPSLTPTFTPIPTHTPVPTDTPLPTKPPPPPPTATPAPPTATPAPSFPFAVTEQGNRVFQKTSYHVITVYIAVVSEGNIPMGGYKVIADSAAGGHIESGLSDWDWSVTNCLDCGYIKQGNLKIELGPFLDGVWNLYLADPDGAPLSPPISFSYAADPEQWVWDFVIFKRTSG